MPVIQSGCKRNEYSAFCQMVDSAGHHTADSPAAVYICDRGYTSYNNFIHVMENGPYFLSRCTDKKTEGISGHSLEEGKALDTHVGRVLPRSQSIKKREHPQLAENYRYICRDIPLDSLTDTGHEYHSWLVIRTSR